MSYSIAVVGAGPTAIYCLQALLECDHPPAAITIFERQRRAGQGTPYSANWADPIMLANIASLEIPRLPQSLVDWLNAESDARLESFGIERADIDDRAFFTRLVVGEYLAAQFTQLVERARATGLRIDVRTQSSVVDVMLIGERIELSVTDYRKRESRPVFDYVILATGHQWPPDPEIRPGYFTSPWPASALARIHDCSVAIRGTSLTAIDASMALATQHGEFVESAGDDHGLQYQAHPGTANFSLTLLSRKGILPEADFYHPIPYEPLKICTVEALQMLAAESESVVSLDAMFELFREELRLADFCYAEAVGLPTLTLEEFCRAYFERREHSDPFDWARRNLEESIVNVERRFTVPWRYAILRMHEVFELLPPYLNDRDFVRFAETLKTVFVDNYATVPHESIRRLLALRTAGKLAVGKLNAGHRLDTRSTNGGATLWVGKKPVHFAVLIEATGQKLLSAKDFPFPSLRRQGVIQDVESGGAIDAKRGIAIDGDYHPIGTFASSTRLFCLSLPFLLGEHPFAQGITSSAEMAEVVAAAIEDAEAERSRISSRSLPSTDSVQ